MGKCHGNSGPLFDSCAPETSNIFNVSDGECVVLQVCGLTEGMAIPIEQAVGPVSEGCWCPMVLHGDAVELSTANTQVTICTPGSYQLDTSAIALGVEPCVKVSAEDYHGDTATMITASAVSAGGPGTGDNSALVEALVSGLANVTACLAEMKALLADVNVTVCFEDPNNPTDEIPPTALCIDGEPLCINGEILCL